MKNFEEYWPKYLLAHRKKLTRRLHLTGIILYLASWLPFLLTLKLKYLILIPIMFLFGHALGATTHFLIEHNHPNTRHIFWGIRGLIKMVWLMLTNGFDREVQKVFKNSEAKNLMEFSK